MKKIISIALFLLPLATYAQLSAVGPVDSIGVKSTTYLTGKTQNTYAFFGKTPMALKAAPSSGGSADFRWFRLNVANTTLDPIYSASNVTESTLNSSTYAAIGEGGYQVIVQSVTNPTASIDTFTTWIFRDTFVVNTISVYEMNCERLALEVTTTPTINVTYKYYSFPNTPSPFREYVFQGVQDMQWESSVNIHEGVDNADESWKIRKSTRTFIDSPPPLKDATYSVEIKDVFGRYGTKTTGNVIPAIAAYANINTQDWDNTTNNWRDNCSQSRYSATACQPEGEALYKVQFSAKNSINGTQFDWKGFGNRAVRNGEQTVMWSKNSQNINDWIVPQVPYKGLFLDGYTPGEYKVRLVVRNTSTSWGCADSTDIQYIKVKPSEFDKESIPNAFTPNNDGQNDIFKFVKGKEPVSLEYVNIYIYNRSGHLVYKYEGRSDAWQGWNGKMMGTGSNVADGVYFYVVNGEGWDGVMYNSSQYKGNVTIFR